MSTLAHVWAVEVEPGWYEAESRHTFVRHGMKLYRTGYEAANGCDDILRYCGNIYPAARVVEFELVEVHKEAK
jgi:hypothetical protein